MADDKQPKQKRAPSTKALRIALSAQNSTRLRELAKASGVPVKALLARMSEEVEKMGSPDSVLRGIAQEAAAQAQAKFQKFQ